ncbi:MAG: hypothetical protein M4D80_32465 [Myxococcota bacterium]|nr:hypothetical protein [Deltaproteobacteria bacterium]MDQ3339898.1 hypothetical protein [Myxococcota bacterium]
MIPGGGIGDGDIDGKVFVHVIDTSTDLPVVSATVAIGGVEKPTDAKGFVEFEDVDGPQTIAVKMQGYRPTVWALANGKNVTIPISKTAASQMATLSGSITGWDPNGLGAGHIKGAAVLYSQNDRLGDEANNITTPANMNVCTGAQCNWTVNVRSGTVTLVAAIVDFDSKGTVTQADDTIKVIGWATKTGIVVEAGVNQSGLALSIVEAGNLEDITIDYGSPPASLTSKASLIGIEIGDDEVVQLPQLDPMATTLLAPKPSVFGPSAGLRLTAVAQSAMGDLGPQSIVIRRSLTGTTLAAGAWLTPPVGVTATRTSASWQLVSGAALHQVQYRDTLNTTLLEITVFDDNATTVEVPPLVALPASGSLSARVSGIGADIDVQDFSLEEDEELLFAIAAQPVAIP